MSADQMSLLERQASDWPADPLYFQLHFMIVSLRLCFRCYGYVAHPVLSAGGASSKMRSNVGGGIMYKKETKHKLEMKGGRADRLVIIKCSTNTALSGRM